MTVDIWKVINEVTILCIGQHPKNGLVCIFMQLYVTWQWRLASDIMALQRAEMRWSHGV